MQVMIDRDLARLYEVETKVLNQAVKRNIERFPEQFCFQLSEAEAADWSLVQGLFGNGKTLDSRMASRICLSLTASPKLPRINQFFFAVNKWFQMNGNAIG
jgi:hypothetical protein